MLMARVGDVVVLGIDANNVRLLQDDKPIVKDLAPLGIKLQVAIIYGKTLIDVATQIREALVTAAEAPND